MGSVADLEYAKRAKMVQEALPTTGPLGAYLDWAKRTTDADPLYHLAAALAVWSHHMNRAELQPDNHDAFRVTYWLVGQPASSKSTAIKRVHTFYRDVIRKRPSGAQGGVTFVEPTDPFVEASGTPQGLYETIVETTDEQSGRHLGVFFHEEIGSQFDQLSKTGAATYVSFLCRQVEGARMDRNLVRIKQANRKKAGTEAEQLDNYAFPGIFATTFGSLSTFYDHSLVTGGLFSRILFAVGTRGRLNHKLRVGSAAKHRKHAIAVWREWDNWFEGQRYIEKAPPPGGKVTIPEELDPVLESTLFADLNEATFYASSYKRGLEYAKEIAGLFALNDRRYVVNADDLNRAIALVRASVLGLQDIVANVKTRDDPLGPKVALAFRLIRAAGKDGLIKSHLAQELACSRRDFEEVTGRLMDMDLIGLYPMQTGKPGRPPLAYVALRAEMDARSERLRPDLEATEHEQTG